MSEQQSAIERDPKKLSGKPCIRGTRLPLWHLIEHIEGGYEFEEYAELYQVDEGLVARAYREFTD